MPRGQALPDAAAALYAAADRILAQRGPEGITSRALTAEAGVAKGVLHNHFGDLDGFLTSYAVERTAAAFARVDSLLAKAGTGEVIDNLSDAGADLFGSGVLGVSVLLSSRPALFGTVRETLDQTGEGFDRLERGFAEYLEAEQRLGRVPSSTDSQMLAFHLIGSIHHLFFTSGQQPLEARQVRRVVSSLLGSK